MARLQVLDTLPAFERYWRGASSKPLEVQIDRWEHEYMAAWPELLEKLRRNYSELGVDRNTSPRPGSSRTCPRECLGSVASTGPF